MNWFYAIPTVGAIALLLVDPLIALIMLVGFGAIVAASFLMEWLFSPPKA